MTTDERALRAIIGTIQATDLAGATTHELAIAILAELRAEGFEVYERPERVGLVGGVNARDLNVGTLGLAGGDER